MADILGGQEHTFNESFGFIYFICKFLSFSQELTSLPELVKNIPSLAATEQKTVEGGGDSLPMDMQSFTYVFALDYCEGEDHTIERPRDYDFWRSYQADFWPGKLLDWTGVLPRTLQPREFGLFSKTADLWRYRRIIDRTNFLDRTFESDITHTANNYQRQLTLDVPGLSRRIALSAEARFSLYMVAFPVLGGADVHFLGEHTA
jgi:hypothetical protein